VIYEGQIVQVVTIVGHDGDLFQKHPVTA